MSYDDSYGNQDSGFGGDQGQGGFQDPNAQGGGFGGDQGQGGFQDPNAQGGGFGGDQGQGGYQDPNAQGGGFGGDPSVDPNAGYGGDSSNVQDTTDTGEKKHHYVKDGLEAAAVGGIGYEAYKHHEDKDNPQAQPEKKSWF